MSKNYKLREKLEEDIIFYIKQEGAIGISLTEMIDTILNQFDL